MGSVLLALLILLVVLLIGVPIPFAFFASALTLVIVGGYDYSFLTPYAYNEVGSITLIAIPLFIVAGAFMEKSGIAESLVNWVSLFVGKIKGGLAPVMVVTCGLFGAISGSGMAALSCIGSIMLPRMYAAGYPKGYCAALISSASVLALLIPPSMDMIMYAFIGGQSILASFMATVVPGIILIVLFSIISLIMLRKEDDIKLPEPVPKAERKGRVGKTTFKAIPALLCPIIILGGIYGGFMTPTEAAAVAVVYALPVGIFIYKGLNKENAKQALIESAGTTGVIMLMLLGVSMVSRLYIMEDLPNMILNAMLSISENRAVLLLMLNLFLLIIGMLMDDASAILLATPILLPIANQLGVDGVQFAAVIGVNLGMGCVTPPCAPFLFLGSRVAGTPVATMLKPTIILILFAWLPTTILVTFVPGLTHWLPGLLGLC